MHASVVGIDDIVLEPWTSNLQYSKFDDGAQQGRCPSPTAGVGVDEGCLRGRCVFDTVKNYGGMK